jgi:glycosyltransferase involved in cell wall biosynthesis
MSPLRAGPALPDRRQTHLLTPEFETRRRRIGSSPSRHEFLSSDGTPDLEVVRLSTSFGFLSSYPPTQCGLATFTAALRAEVELAGHVTGVVRVLERPEPFTGVDVLLHLVHGQPAGVVAAARALNAFDVVVVQHEYGIYDGPDGDSVVDVLDRLTVPAMVVLHTVLVEPTPHQRHVLNAIAERAGALITMTETARDRLFAHYDVDASKVFVVPHGASAIRAGRGDPAPGRGPLMLTWGLLGPGKGIERVIDALPSLRDLVPSPHYLVVGDTHPRVLKRDGEAYRNGLLARAERLGVADMVSFRPGYLDVASLGALAKRADVVLLPYDSREQVTSGVLIEAVTACRPVIATAFAHAVELLASGAGLLVDHDDPAAMTAAIRQVLCEPAQAASMVRHAAGLAPDLLWDAVAARYCAVADDLIAADAPATT